MHLAKRHLKKLLPLFAAAILSTNIQATQITFNQTGNVFIEMMLTMMEAMGLINRDNKKTDDIYPDTGFSGNWGQGLPQSGQWQNLAQLLAMQQLMNGVNPGNITGYSSLAGLTPPGTFPGFSGNTNNLPWTLPLQKRRHWIEGLWKATDGMLMEIHQGKFKMYYRNRPGQVRKGLIRIKDGYLALFETSSQISRQFEYAHQDGRLVLKDEYDNLLLFKRQIEWPVKIPYQSSGKLPDNYNPVPR